MRMEEVTEVGRYLRQAIQQNKEVPDLEPYEEGLLILKGHLFELLPRETDLDGSTLRILKAYCIAKLIPEQLEEPFFLQFQLYYGHGRLSWEYGRYASRGMGWKRKRCLQLHEAVKILKEVEQRVSARAWIRMGNIHCMTTLERTES